MSIRRIGDRVAGNPVPVEGMDPPATPVSSISAVACTLVCRQSNLSRDAKGPYGKEGDRTREPASPPRAILFQLPHVPPLACHFGRPFYLASKCDGKASSQRDGKRKEILRPTRMEDRVRVSQRREGKPAVASTGAVH